MIERGPWQDKAKNSCKMGTVARDGPPNDRFLHNVWRKIRCTRRHARKLAGLVEGKIGRISPLPFKEPGRIDKGVSTAHPSTSPASER